MPPPQHPQSRSHSYPSATTSHSTHTSAKFAPVPHSSFGGDHLIHEIGDRSLHDGNWLGGITIFVTTANALFGISVFTIPWGFQRSGIILGCGLTILVAWISFETSRIVLTAQSKLYASTGHVYSYPEISNEYLGSPFGALVKTSTVVSCFGGCIGSLIFSAGLLSQLLGITAQDALIYYCFLPLVLLSWIRSFKELTIFSVFGCVAIIASVVTLIIDGYSQRTYTSFPPLPLTHIIPSLSFIGPLTFLFTIHYIILSIGKEFMLHDQRSRVHRALPLVHGPAHEHNAPPGSSNQSLLFYVKVAYVFTVIVLCALGILGVILYRHSPAPRSRAGIVFPGCEDGICDNILLHITHGRTR